ncbi:hypothetical protein K8T06_10240 [bacterium]|nr:hypothetical protein [bacterium]
MMLIIFLAGCRTELQHGMVEDQANEIMLVLLNSGIDAIKDRDSTNQELWMISVADEHLDQALNILLSNELPRDKPNGFSELFDMDGFIPSDLQQQAKYISALSGELQQTLEADDSILMARVHIHTQTSGKRRIHSQTESATASIFLKVLHDCSSGSLSDDSVKALVANSVSNLVVENVVVVRSISKKHMKKGVIPGDLVSRSAGKSKNHRVSLILLVMVMILGIAVIILSVIGISKKLIRKKQVLKELDK